MGKGNVKVYLDKDQRPTSKNMLIKIHLQLFPKPRCPFPLNNFINKRNAIKCINDTANLYDFLSLTAEIYLRVSCGRLDLKGDQIVLKE